ncbi:hypothetical protein SEVIR_9G527000v4 [Setaria viridis]|uniref:Uncharacterized protein n=1 Tax=Setaria viridis TaxID=4556 RepID=A0A4V6D5K7_SETVI|nr:uncharacterized protein LOC117836108 [Setaria viridis]XP_034571374.1 uncharacterized protein LOC117836108 [Setaria viridis]TKV97945.1 hypothetical protein SEVIR_9G527000v2 [Setaria viridis]
MSGRPPHLPRPVTTTEGQNPLIPMFHLAPVAAAVPSPTNHSPPPPPPGTIVAMSERPPHLPRPVIATWGQNPLIPPFHLAPAPNLYGAAVIPPRPHAPPPSAASGDPTLQFRVPPSGPADALLHSVQNAQSSSFLPPQGYSAMPQHGTSARSQPLRQNWRPQSPLLREPQGGGIVPPCGAWASQPLPRKRRLEHGACSDSKRIKKVTMQITFIPVLDFLDKYPPIEPYEFKVGSTVGSIPEPQTLKTTRSGVSVVDGYVGLFEDTHAKNKSWGGDFDVTDMLVSEEPLLCVTINKEPNLDASISNSNKDLEQLVTVLLKPRYGENGKRPAYVDDFITRVKNLRKSKSQRRPKLMWIIRNHPLLVESAKRRLVLHEFYTFYKMLDNRTRENLLKKMNRPRYDRWHLLIAPKDAFISTVYWKGREHQCPEDHFVKDYSTNVNKKTDENHNIFPFTSQDGYLALLLRHFIVHGPHDAELVEAEFEELDLIIAYYFEEFLAIFLDEISSETDNHEMLKEILTTYADRRSVFRIAPG